MVDKQIMFKRILKMFEKENYEQHEEKVEAVKKEDKPKKFDAKAHREKIKAMEFANAGKK